MPDLLSQLTASSYHRCHSPSILELPYSTWPTLKKKKKTEKLFPRFIPRKERNEVISRWRMPPSKHKKTSSSAGSDPIGCVWITIPSCKLQRSLLCRFNHPPATAYQTKPSNATQRNATQRNATQRNATQGTDPTAGETLRAPAPVAVARLLTIADYYAVDGRIMQSTRPPLCPTMCHTSRDLKLVLRHLSLPWRIISFFLMADIGGP